MENGDLTNPLFNDKCPVCDADVSKNGVQAIFENPNKLSAYALTYTFCSFSHLYEFKVKNKLELHIRENNDSDDSYDEHADSDERFNFLNGLLTDANAHIEKLEKDRLDLISYLKQIIRCQYNFGFKDDLEYAIEYLRERFPDENF